MTVRPVDSAANAVVVKVSNVHKISTIEMKRLMECCTGINPLFGSIWQFVAS
jgi:hypothetical protein